MLNFAYSYYTPILHFLLPFSLPNTYPSIYPPSIYVMWKEYLFSFLKDIFFSDFPNLFCRDFMKWKQVKKFLFSGPNSMFEQICSQHMVDFSDFPLNISPGKKWGKQKLNPGSKLIFYHLHPCRNPALCVSSPLQHAGWTYITKKVQECTNKVKWLAQLNSKCFNGLFFFPKLSSVQSHVFWHPTGTCGNKHH